MKAMNELTRLGRIRRSRRIIEIGLEAYNLEVKTLTFLIEETNIFFKLIDQDGRKYAVKIYEDLSSDMDDSIVEMYFLHQVTKNTDIIVPEPLLNKNNDYVTRVDSKWSVNTKRIAVYNWLEGKSLDGFESVDYFHQIGIMTAKLHQCSRSLGLPEHIKSKRLDKVLYYAGDDYFYKMDKHKQHVSKAYLSVVEYLMPIIDKKMANMYTSQPMLIHGDLNPWNIWINKNRVDLMDFEDTSMGYAIHDIAILFYYYRLKDDFELYKQAFFKGYETIDTLPIIDQGTLDMLYTARDLNFLNYILEVSDDPKEYIERTLKRVMAYIEKYHPDNEIL